MMANPAIAILPYGHRLGPKLAGVPLSELIWPEGCPERLTGKTVGDLERTDHLIMYPNSTVHLGLRRGTRAQISLMMGEPSAIHAKHDRMLRYTWRRFFRVLTFHDVLLQGIPNAVFLPYGVTMVPDWQALSVEKTKSCSLIASAKRNLKGHQLRHSVINWVRDSGADVEIMGRGYTPFERKSDGLAPYRFSVVIENVRERNYFSEKLTDTILCATVPIYWGCPNISDFFDTSGMVLCKTETDIHRAIQSVSPEDYARRLPHLHSIQQQAAEFGAFERRAVAALRAELP
ncbi:glycosyltransferase family 10 domain-containing protein [Ruegeria meonggei]|uniref:Glycosyltransferase family 10 (Fucosyltransferase) n=1 Tax=Ruegeria meonggei TaxID=1446476 RepID=A0A1X6YIR6_9RHOB|nr:glycosyltransferase family 10 [Ruegeria meonggei]SLN22452.1 Glycosyltransferase family 10 (fucosyltransferase) [Ruegeria meonggei]